MAETKTIQLPDVGDFNDIEIIEVLVAAGDVVDKEQSIIVLESDKATMEIPSPHAGTIKSVDVGVGDRVNEGDKIGTIEVGDGQDKDSGDSEPARDDSSEDDSADDDEGSSADDSGKDEKAEGGGDSGDDAKTAAPAETSKKQDVAPGRPLRPHPGSSTGEPVASQKMIHATPSIRRYARELGADLTQVVGTGPKGRILKEDVKAFIKAAMASGGDGGGSGIQVSSAPAIDHSKFGEIEVVPLSRIKKISGAHLHRSWVTVPHVTQFDEADITELEAFRKSLAPEAEKKSLRLTPLVFLMKAVVSALVEYPDFNASLDESGENLIMKKYFNIGIAVDTPNGLVVPVVRDVDRKGLFDLAAELGDISARARDGKLSPSDMQGGCFTISSLGGIGGTSFTPIVNAPEVAILGVSRSRMQPVYIDGEFQPRLILPLGLSYDHRVIDGAQGARFTSYLVRVISDIRRILL